MFVSALSGVPLSSLTPYSGGGANPFDGRNRTNGVYDAVGNQTAIGSLQITYDARNRQISLSDALDRTLSVQYRYDGEGHRVSKEVAGTGKTIYVYDAFGNLASEYQESAPAASPCRTCYLAYDHLGSVRLVMDAAGNAVARHDYLPFGEEIASGSAGRTSPFGFTDGISQRFTGQQRDFGTAPNLDYFKARYFNGEQGRFLSPDPGNLGADPNSPQSWNAYSYALNSPVVYSDPNGTDPIRITTPPVNVEAKYDKLNPLEQFWYRTFAGPPEPLEEKIQTKVTRQRQSPPNSRTQSCAVQRLVAAANGVVSLGIGITKARLAAASALSIPATGPLGAVGAAYGVLGAAGNITAGGLQLAGALTGSVSRFGNAANMATTLTTAGGFSVWLATRGDIAAASTAANFESLGTAGVNGGITGHLIDQSANRLQKIFLTTDLGRTVTDTLGLDNKGHCY